MPRLDLLAPILAGLVAGPLAAQIPSYDGPPPTATVAYGGDPLQFGELRVPEGDGPFPVAITIHGGCWLDSMGEGSITPVAAALAEEGIATWNVEYRRLGHEGGGWPGTFLDVGAGVDHLREVAAAYPLDLTRVVVLGHSSGAPLAVWAAGRPGLPEQSEIRGERPLEVRAAVAIDGPTDLAAWSASGADARVCGRPVISELLGGSAETHPERYRDTSPAEMPTFDAAIYLTPAAMVLQTGGHDALTRRAAASGEEIVVRPVPNSDHFQLITPGHETWQTVLETIRLALDHAR